MDPAASAHDSFTVEKGNEDCNVIVIDDDDPHETTPSSSAAANANPAANPKRSARFKVANSSSVPFTFERPLTSGSAQKTKWEHVSFILTRQSPMAGPAPQGMDSAKDMTLEQSKSLEKSIGLVPLMLKPFQTPQPSMTTSVQGLPAALPASSIPAGITSDAIPGSDSVVLVFPCKPQSADSSQPAKHQVKMQSLLPKSPLTQQAAGNPKTSRKVYYIQEGQKLSQLKKVLLETKSNTLPTKTPAETKESSKAQLKGALQSKLASLEAVKPINGSTSDSPLGGSSTPPNVKVVTISKDGIVQPKISHVVISNQSILSQLMSGKKEINAVGSGITAQSIQSLISSAPVSSPPVVQKSSNFIPILPLPNGQSVKSASGPAAGQPLLASSAAVKVPRQFSLSSQDPSTNKPIFLPATMQEGFANLIKSGNKHILFVPKDTNTIATNLNPLRMSLLHKGTPPTQFNAAPPTQFNATLSTQSIATPPTQSKATPPTQSKSTPPTQSKATPLTQSKAIPPTQPSKSILRSYMFEKEGLSVTGKETVKKSLLNNNISGVKDKNGNGQPENKEHVYFTTLRTGNGQIAVKVIQPNLHDDPDPEWVSSPSLKKTLVIKSKSDKVASEQPIKNTLNLPIADDAGLAENQSRIKKASKLEKIVENILRSHKTDDNVSLEKTNSVEPLFCASSSSVHNSAHATDKTIITKSVSAENSFNTSKDKHDLSGQNDLDLKITSVFSLNPDSSTFPNEPDNLDLSEDSFTCKSENSFTCKVGDSPSWTKVVTPCFTVVERLPRCRGDPEGASRTVSQCSEHCRNRTLDYLCNLKLLKCESVYDEQDGVHSPEEDQVPSCTEETVVEKEESDPDWQDTEAVAADASTPTVECPQLKEIEEKTHLECAEASLEISTVDQHPNSHDIQSNVGSEAESTQTDVKIASNVSKLVINVNSLIHSVTSSHNQKSNVEECTISDTKNVHVSPQTQSSNETCLLKNSPSPIKKVATGKHVVSLLNPSLLSPGIVNKTGHEVLSFPEGSAFKKGMDPKEFQQLLTELKDQVERKRKEMKRIHQLKKKKNSLCLKNKRETAKVNFPFMVKKSAVSPNSPKLQRRTKPGFNASINQTKTSTPMPTSPEKLKSALSAALSPGPILNALPTPTGGTIKPISADRIKEAISSLTKYLLTTGTRVTSDNNKYFLLKVDEQHVLVKIPQDFPMNTNLTPVTTSTKHIPIKPKPDAPTPDSGLQRHTDNPSPGLKTILPQSQRSVTLMARLNKARSGERNGFDNAETALVKSDTNMPTGSISGNTNTPVKVNLAQLPLTSSLLPQRRKRNLKLTEEERKAKRAKLEAKYPLPPGVIIKCEQDDPTDYPIDDNWTVTSEFLTSPITESSRCDGQGENPAVSLEERDEPPTLMSVSPVWPATIACVQDEAEDETPPLLQPMLPAPPGHCTERTQQSHGTVAECASSCQTVDVKSQTSLSSGQSGYASDSIKPTNPAFPKSAYKNSKIERLKELLKKKELEIEEIRKMRRNENS